MLNAYVDMEIQKAAKDYFIGKQPIGSTINKY